MIKAMLIVMSVGGAGNYSVEMPTMEQCLESDTVKIEKFLSMFSNMVKEMKKIE
jgi:hypothetical protein